MIYLIRHNPEETRSCESERTAALAEAQGFERVSRATYLQERRTNDIARISLLRQEDIPSQEPDPSPVVAPRLPAGFTLFHPRKDVQK